MDGGTNPKTWVIISVLLVVIGCITAAGKSASGGVLPPDDSVRTSDEIKQSIRDFAAASGESVTAEDVVSFLDQHIQQAPAAGDGAGDQISFSSEQRFSFARASYISAAALSSSEFVVAYCDWGNSYRGTAVVGEVSGTDITFGSEYVFNSANTWYISAAGLSPSAFVVAYQDMGNSDYGTAVIGEVSGTAITFGSEYVFNSDDTDSISAAGLSSTKFVVAYRDWGNSLYGTAVVGDVSGTAITFGSEYVFNSDATYYISAAALSSTEFVVAYSDAGSSDYGTAVVGDVSGTAITFGSEYVFNSDITNDISAAALSSSAFVVAYRDEGNSWYGTAVVGDVSGTAITFGSEYVFNSDITYYISAAALSSSKFVVAYHDWGGSDYGTAVIGDVSGTAITFGTEYVFNLAGTSYISVAVLSSSEFVVAYRDAGNSNYGTAVVGDVSGTAITFGTEYVFNFGPTSYISAAALSSSKFVVAYSDAGSSNRGTAIVGDVSGSAITFGSEYVFNLAGTSYISAAALSSSKFVVAYQDAGNSNYGTAVVGIVVSGTAINFGSERFFHSNPTSYISAAALSSSKFVVAYRDAVSYGTAVVGDVSGTTVITFGSHYVFNFGSTYDISAAALSSTKFVVAYWDDGNSGYGTAVVGDVSGTAITFGSEYVFNSAVTNYISVAVLSSSEFVVAYCDGGNFNYGTAVVGDVSGTAITFGSEYVFNFGSTYDISAIGLSSSEFVVAYRDAGNFDYGTAVVGDVNGTAIGFGSEYVFNFGPTSYISAVGLSSTEFVVAYRDAGSFDYGTAVIGTVRRTRTLTVSSTTGGSVTTPGEGVFQYDYNDVVPIAAEPNAHYGFVEWTGTAVDAGKVADPCAASTTVTIHGNYTLVANFAIDQHALTVSSTSGGEVTTPGEGIFQYDYNDVVPIVAEPDPNYQLWEWTGTAVVAGKVADPCAASTTVTMDGDYTLVANFVPQKTLMVSSTPYGSVTTPGEGVFGYDYGEVVPIVAEPNVDCEFAEWTGTAVTAGKVADANAASTTVTMDGDYSLVANFVPQKTLTVSSTPYGSVTTPGEGVFYYDYGIAVPIVAEPNVDCEFAEWTGTAVSAGKVAEPEEASTTVTMHGNYTLVANFAMTIIYVDANAPGANDGTSWANAYNYLQDALMDASSNPDVNDIWVAEGTYKPDQGGGQDPNDRDATFQLINGVGIYGGFAGGESNLNERDWITYETILSGDINTADVNTDNSYHVVTGSGTEPNAILDGFTITAGYADGESPDNRGGGMYNAFGSPTVTNCTFSGNSANTGGGMRNSYSNSDVTNCTFGGNSANYGGGMYIYSSDTTVTNCTFTGNSANYGGGMYNIAISSPTVTNCTFSGNSAVFSGGGMTNTGESTAQVVNCTFSGNTAFNAGGGLANSSSSEPNITNCILWGNTASIGAQIYDDGTSSTTVSYSDVQGGWAGATNIGDDPMFKDADGPDDTVGTEDDDLRLSPDSPCIDVGDNNSVPADIPDLDNDGNTVEPLPYDLDARGRFADGDCNDTDIVDMGAYEFDWVYIGDFAGGCDVDFFDFSVLGLTWMLEEGEAGYDPNCDISIPADKYIDWWDVDIFGKNWLAGK